MQLSVTLKDDGNTVLKFNNLEKALPSNLRLGIKRACELVRSGTVKNLYSGKYGIRQRHGSAGLAGSLNYTIKGSGNSIKGIVGSNLRYALIQEKGGVITAKKDYLRFKIGEQWVSKKSVKIPAHWYLRNTMVEKKAAILRIVEKAIVKGMK